MGNFKGGLGDTGPLVQVKSSCGNLNEMLTYALALLNHVFLMHKHYFLNLF